MNPYCFILVVATPLTSLMVHAALQRFLGTRSKSNQTVAMKAAALTTLFNTLVISGMTPSDHLTLSYLSFVAINSALLAHVYFHLFNMSETARRIRFLQTLTMENYTPDDLIRVRIERLVGWGKLKIENGKCYSLNRWFELAAWLVKSHELLLFPERREKIKALDADHPSRSLTREPA